MSPKLRLLILCGLLVVELDYVSKSWIRESLAENQVQPLLGDLVVLTHVKASAASMLAISDVAIGAQIALSVLAVILLGTLAIRSHRDDRLSGLALGLILGGGAGNAIDRFYFHEIIDWARVAPAYVSLPTFNLADLAIAAGIALLLLDIGASEAADRGAGPPALAPAGDARAADEGAHAAAVAADGAPAQPSLPDSKAQ